MKMKSLTVHTFIMLVSINLTSGQDYKDSVMVVAKFDGDRYRPLSTWRISKINLAANRYAFVNSLESIRPLLVIGSVKLPYQSEVKRYRGMRNAGIPLSLLGGILMIIGSQEAENATAGNGDAMDGIWVTLLGAGCLAAGIPLSIAGIRGGRKYKENTEKALVRIHLNSRSKGIALTCKF